MAVRILATSALYGNAVKELGEKFPELRIVEFRSDEWNRLLPNAEALLVILSNVITVADLDIAINLKVIGTFSVGTNHLPVEECRKRGIKIANTPDVLTEATADLALALLMAAARRITEGDRLVRTKNWKGWAPDLLLGHGLQGKTCAILGSGPIGRAFALRASAVGLQPLFWDREGKGGVVEYGWARTAERLSLNALLARAQILSLHCPLTPETRGLLTRDKLLQLPKGAIFINTARGGIVDETALMDLLDNGHMAAAGIDVFEAEPEINPRWLTTPNTVLLPHLGSATSETRDAMAGLACGGIAGVLAVL